MFNLFVSALVAMPIIGLVAAPVFYFESNGVALLWCVCFAIPVVLLVMFVIEDFFSGGAE